VNPKNAPVNDLIVFIDFVEKHPVGSIVNATIESFSSHGAYAMAGPARCYVPLRFMGSPAPRSARDVVKLGDERALVVVSFNAARRGIDAALEGFEPPDVVRVPAAAKARKRTKKAETPEAEPTPTSEPVIRKRTAKKAKAVAEAIPEKLEQPAPIDVEVVAPKAKKASRKKAVAAAPEPPPPPTPPEPPTKPPTKAKRAATPRKKAADKAVAPAAEPVKAVKKARAKKVAAPA
jgi:hypothetical protein